MFAFPDLVPFTYYSLQLLQVDFPIVRLISILLCIYCGTLYLSISPQTGYFHILVIGNDAIMKRVSRYPCGTLIFCHFSVGTE